MKGYDKIRDTIDNALDRYAGLEVAQLVKHAFSLRTLASSDGEYAGLQLILFYLYAEPDAWPGDGKPIDDDAKAAHRGEIDHFAKSVEGDEVRFIAFSYRELLAMWERSENLEVREHDKAIACRFSP